MNLSPTFAPFIAVALIALASDAYAQSPRQPPSPVLLKRLAEAVDGNRTGRPVFVVASYDSLSPVRGVFGSRGEAEELARRLGLRYDVFGPFVATRDPFPFEMVRGGCVHDGHTSAMIDVICPQGPWVIADVTSLTLVARMRDGTTREMTMAPQVDAIFLTLPAIDKFMLPYYAGIIGLDAAAAMRARIVGGVRTP